MSVFSLCLTYTLICQTCLTAPDPGRISQQARQHTDHTIFSQPKSRHRPMQSSTLICLPSVSPSFSPPLIFYVLLSTLPPSISVTFPLSPTASIHLCPCLPSLESFLLHHCHAPHCFSPPCVSSFSFLPTETPFSLCLFVLLSSLLCLSSIFLPVFFFLNFL